MDTDSFSNYSKEEIAKRFDLPERKSKIRTIFKMKDDKPVYCICHSADISRFMICCEKCDEWYHGDCIGMKESVSKYIKKWYCYDCVDKYQLKIVYFSDSKKPSATKIKHKRLDEHSKRKSPYDKESLMPEHIYCGQCSICLQSKVCGNKPYTLTQNTIKQSNIKDREVNLLTNNTSKSNQFIKANLQKVNNSYFEENKLLKKTKQCIGPNCCNQSRVNSKYCSDNCGLALAKLRILYILPDRIKQRAEFTSVAESLDKIKLDHNAALKKLSWRKLKDLSLKERDIIDLIRRSKLVPIQDDDKKTDDESKMYCSVCGWEILCRSAVRHMELCFQKRESQTELVGPVKTNLGYSNIFCDHYDSSKNIYCKRLRYVCPNHFKLPKIGKNQVCGCPIITITESSILNGSEKFCQKRKIDCEEHYNWEAVALSDVDLERFREMNKYNQLIEEENTILRQLINRTGALGVLLHSTEPTIHK